MWVTLLIERFQFKLLALFISVFITSSCSNASSSFSKKAQKIGFKTTFIQGKNFQHTIYNNKLSTKKGVLHVYLGGDGTPWFKGRYITRDPTPLNPIMLKLMKQDTAAAIYLGRPCYHQQQMPSHCDTSLWTNKRYSLMVVESMVAALKQYIQQHQDLNTKEIEIKLFGFSGGGTLAMLIAPRIHGVSTVITLAGNLDTDTWTNHHGFLPLKGSLNPAKQPPLASHIKQTHLAGSLDKTVPAFIIKSALKRQPNSRYILLQNADHHCCWQEKFNSLITR
jgi:dienelactone hydrolase